MRRRMKRGISLLLCGILCFVLFSACGQGTDAPQNVTYGRYVEVDITPDGMEGFPSALYSFGNGQLDFTVVDWGNEEDPTTTYHRWRSSDNGESWEEVDMAWTQDYINDYSEYYERGETPPEEVFLGTLLPLEDGDMLATVSKYVYTEDAEGNLTTDYTSEFYRVALDGTMQPFVLPAYQEMQNQGKNAYINEMRPLPGGRLYANIYIEPTQAQIDDPEFDWSSTDKRAVFDLASGEKLYDINADGWNMYYNANTLFLYDYSEGFTALDLATGAPANVQMPAPEVLQSYMESYVSTMFVDNNNCFYSLNARGLNRLDAQGEAPEEVMDGINYTFGSPVFEIGSAVYDTDEEALVVALYETRNMQNSGRLLRYVWDDEAIASSDNKLSIYTLYDNYTVRLGLSEFKRKYPDVTLDLEVVFETQEDDGWDVMPALPAGGAREVDNGVAGGETGQTLEDAIRELNTELLNGTGPDVIVLDGLPVESLIDKGVLEDLSALVDGNEDLIMSVFDGMRADGNVYAVPTNFYMPVLFGEKDYIRRITSLDALVNEITAGPDVPGAIEWDPEWTPEEEDAYWQEMYGPKTLEQQPVMLFGDLIELFTMLYEASAPGIYSEKEGINPEALTDFLQAMKAIADKYGLADSMGDFVGASAGMGMSSGYASYEISAALSNFMQRQSRLGYSRLGSLEIVRQVEMDLHWSGDMYGDAMIEPYVLADGAAEETDVRQPVVEKVAPAVSAAPGVVSGVYFPAQMVGVTTTSKQTELATELVATLLSEEVQRYDMGNGFPVSRAAFEYQQELSQKNYNGWMAEEGVLQAQFDFDALTAELNMPFYTNLYLRDTIYTSAYRFCSGELNLQEAVDQIVQETELYFAERQ